MMAFCSPDLCHIDAQFKCFFNFECIEETKYYVTINDLPSVPVILVMPRTGGEKNFALRQAMSPERTAWLTVAVSARVWKSNSYAGPARVGKGTFATFGAPE
jgi:hypothetical protein